MGICKKKGRVSCPLLLPPGRHSMATGHRDFLETLENGVSVRAYCLSEWRKACTWRRRKKTWGFGLVGFYSPFIAATRLTYMEFRNVKRTYMKFRFLGIASRHSDKISARHLWNVSLRWRMPSTIASNPFSNTAPCVSVSWLRLELDFRGWNYFWWPKFSWMKFEACDGYTKTILHLSKSPRRWWKKS